MASLASFLPLLPPDLRVVLADVGSAGGLHGRWQAIRPVVSGLMFEPRDSGEVRRVGADVSFPTGLGETAGTQSLNITALPNMSSTLAPNAELLRTYAKKGEHTRIVERAEMRVSTLDQIVRAEAVRIDAMKVDTQGSELGILKGARQCLGETVILAEIEVSFFPRYLDQALACEIIAFMAGCGFDLIDLYRLKRYRRANQAGIGNMSLGSGQRSGRLAYCDAIFVRREADLLAQIREADADSAEALALKSVLLLLVYGKPDLASFWFDQVAFAVREPWRGGIAAWFSKVGRRMRGTGVFHHVADYMSRHV